MESRTPAVPFKANAAWRHHIPKQRHRVTNWAEYDAGLRARGSLTVWFTPEAVAAWAAAPRLSRGGQPSYSDLAIATALTLRAVFRLALRQTEGLISSILQLLDLDLPVPDHSTLSRRAETLQVPRPKAGSGAGAPAGGQHGAEALRPGRVAGGEARHQAASVVEETPPRHGRRHWPDRCLGAHRQGCRRRLPGRPPARADRWGSGILHRRWCLRPRRCLRRGRCPPSRCGRGRATARECGAERDGRDRADAARPVSAMYRRARPHGLAAGVGIQLACSGGGRYRALERRYWRRAALADGGATSDRGSHRHQCSEPHVGLRAPGVRPHRITRNTGRAQCVYTADPCNTVAELVKVVEGRPHG